MSRLICGKNKAYKNKIKTVDNKLAKIKRLFFFISNGSAQKSRELRLPKQNSLLQSIIFKIATLDF